MTGKLDMPAYISLIALPAKCPELNPVKSIWQFMCDNWLSSRVFTSYDNIVDHAAAQRTYRCLGVGHGWFPDQGLVFSNQIFPSGGRTPKTPPLPRQRVRSILNDSLGVETAPASVRMAAERTGLSLMSAVGPSAVRVLNAKGGPASAYDEDQQRGE